MLLFLLCFIVIPIFKANSVDPDQMARSAVSDMGLYCLSMFLSGKPGIIGSIILQTG